MKQYNRRIGRALTLLLVIVLGAAFAPRQAKASDAQPAAPTGVTAASYNYRAVKIAWQKPAGAVCCRVYRYNATARQYVPVGESAYDNYIAYGLKPGISYYFQVTALYLQNGQTVESAPSAAVRAVPGGDVLNAVSQNAPLPMFTLVDDDTRDPYSVKLYHDVCEANGVRGCYAVVTSKFTEAGAEGFDTMLDQLRAYGADGFDMLLHARTHDARFKLNNRTNGWNGYTAAETAALAEESIRGGYADMTAAGLGYPNCWVAPMGVHDAAITAAAQNAGVECLLGVANKSYVTKNPKQSSYNRLFIPRVELYGTDGAYDAEKKNYQTGRHSSDRIWNTADDVKAQIDAAAANNAWVIICTHVYESEWYLPRITLTKTGAGYAAEAHGAGLSAEWADTAAVPLTQLKYTFIYDKRNGVTGWYFEKGDAPQDLADYGVSLTGTPVYKQADPAAADADRSAFYADRFAEIVAYAKEKGMTNVTFSEGYAAWSAIYDAQERADACHDLTVVPAVAPTCTETGTTEYYQCTVCGDRFADAEGNIQLSVQALSRPVDPTAHRDENGDRACDLCGASLILRAANVSLYSATVTYNGKQRTPVVTVKNAAGEKLTAGRDYTVSIPAGRTDAGTYTYVITGAGCYAGTVSKPFLINPQPLRAANVSLYSATVTYNGKQRTPVVTVKNAAGEKLTAGRDYTVSIPAGRTDAGTYTYVITGTGNYTGAVRKNFTIDPQPLRAANASLYSATVTYNGKQRTPAVTVKNAAGEKLTAGRDYTVKVPDGRTDAGIYPYVITGTGNYTGAVEKPFTINPQPLRAANVSLYAATVTYNGKQRTPVVTVKNAAGGKLIAGRDYTVSVPEGRTVPGTYPYVVTGTGNYTGAVEKPFTINPQAVR